MWSRRRSEAALGSPAQPGGPELAAAFKSFGQTKAALRHIENRLEAAPGTGVLLDSVMDTKKTLSGATRKVSRREGRRSEQSSGPDSASKPRARSRRSPEKSSRSPLRNTTLDSNVRRANCVEFREPLASYREATPPLTPSQLEAHALQAERPPSPLQDPRASQLVYRSDTRDRQSRQADSPASSALDSTTVRYLNDRPALDALQGPGAEASQSSSPGSASQRLEGLRRRQPDDKLEKLKERIRRQREHLEEAAERERLLGYLQQPVGLAGSSAETAPAHAPNVRKVAPAPPAPVYKGFNPTETKIRTPDGKVWREAEFQGLSREMYRDLSLQITENAKVKQRPVEKGREKKPPKPVRKVHKCPDPKPVAPVITTSSWREGLKPGRTGPVPAPRAPREPRAGTTDPAARPAPGPRAHSDPRPSRASSRERPRGRAQSEDLTRAAPTPVSTATGEREGEGVGEGRALNTDLLSADIQGMLDDLKLEGGVEGEGQGPGGAPPRDSKARRRTTRPAGGAPTRLSRSASPAKAKQEEAQPKRRHYDAESVRQYIARQQEERKRKQLEERRTQREEAERRNQRLQDLYRKQREGVAKGQPPNEGPAQKRLQETYTKLLLEQARLGEELPQAQPAVESLQPKPLYQPSGESDKENKRLDRPQSASSSSDLSLSEPQVPLLTRNELGPGRPAWMQPDRLSPAARATGSLAPPAGHLFTHLLGMESGVSGLRREGPAVGLMGGTGRMSRIEALKATAASLSTRIENEARKLAGAGVNYDCVSNGVCAATVPPATARDDGRWAKPVSPPSPEGPEPADLSLRIQRLLSVGQASYDGVLPGVGNLHSFRGLMGPRTASASPPASRGQQEVQQGGARGAGRKGSPHNSSGDSISEGPLLSEGSLSEGDGSPPAPAKGVPKPAALLRAQEYCTEERGSLRPFSLFQKEAEKYPAFSPAALARESRSPWEELAKGSPHSVINIFTKNYSNYSKVLEDDAGGSSPALGSALSPSPVGAGVSAGSMDPGAYEDDFITCSSNGGSRPSGSRGHTRLSLVNSPKDELASRRSPYDMRAVDLASHPSSGSTPASSPRSADSVRKRAGEMSEESLELTLTGSQKSPSSHASEPHRDAVVKGPGRDADSPLRAVSRHSPLSLGSDGRKSPRSPGRSPSGSPAGSGSHRASPGDASPAGPEQLRAGSALPSSSSSSSSARARPPTGPSTFTRPGPTGSAEPKPAGDLHYAPSALQQRMAAELSYLDAMEESVRQLADVERLRGVSLAQQESVSLAQILKSQQQRHERDLFLLKQKAEQEALETRRQLEETRQRAAQAHVELQEKMAHSQQEARGGLQEATSRMISQQAESVRYTADAARHIKEMTELARTQISGALSVPAPPVTTLFDQQRQHHHSFMKQLQSRAEADRQSEGSVRTEEPLSSLSSPTGESSPSQRPAHSGSTSPRTRSSEHQESSAPGRKGKSSSSVEEEVQTAADDSLRSCSVRSLLDEKDNTSVATEYSLKFDESMTEDEIEERSFRSLLPSEAHRRSTLKGSSHEDSEEEQRAQERSSVLDLAKQPDGSMPFSSGQHSFSRFTMDMVRQYMKEEEVRAQHQSSLLRLREKALKDKTKAELAWLEHQKRRLRDKGEDDKMPPIRKRQRGLLLRLQQEQAEIKRLHEANKAARKERQLLLKQQEEIERMRHTTLKLKERLKSAGENNPDTSVSEPAEGPAMPSPSLTDMDTPSPSPLSVSGSETSSIMEKLKKMRSHMDEKHCSPVHYFFSVFSAHNWASLSVCFPNLHPKFQLFIYNQLVRFLTKREQQLMQRRRHAEELLEWRQRLDAEEAEVRRMEKQALAAWDGPQPRDTQPRAEGSGPSLNSSLNASLNASRASDRAHREPDSKAEDSLVLTVYSQQPELSVPEELDCPSTDQPISELPSPHKDASQQEDTVYTQEFDSSSESKLSPSPRGSLSTSRLPESSRGPSSKMPLRSSSMEARSVSQSEPTSDQSDIESRIHALKEELRKRKSIVYQLKKEQRKRQKERLKAQEASLLKQLESYNDFIQKTKAELSKEPDTTPMTKPQIKTPSSASEKPRIKPPPLQRPETSKNWKIATETEKGEKAQAESPIDRDDVTPSGHSRYSSLCEESSDEDPPTVTPTPVQGSPEHVNGLKSLMSPEGLPGWRFEEPQAQDRSAMPHAGDSGDESIISSQRSEVMEELELLKSEESDNDQHSEPALKLVLELQPVSQEQGSLKDSPSAEKLEPGISREKSEEHRYEDLVDAGEDIKSGTTLINQSESVLKDSKDSLPSSEQSTFKKEDSSTPQIDIHSSDREVLPKLKEGSPSADSYHDDFESSVELSPREGHYTLKSTSPTVPQTETRPSTRSPVYSSEEEISEVLNEKSGSGSPAFHSEKFLDLKAQSKLDKDREESEKGREEVISPEKESQSSLPLSPPIMTQDLMPEFSVGDRVLVSNVQPGTLQFKGPTRFANGFWAGVELDKSEGSNNGTYDGVNYFDCKEGHGIFAPPDKISRLPEKFENYMDTTEDEDSLDDQSDNESKKKLALEKQLKQSNLQDKKVDKSVTVTKSGEKEPSDVSEALGEHHASQGPSEKGGSLGSTVQVELNDLESKSSEKINGDKHPTPNGKSRNIILEFEDATTGDYGLIITDVGNVSAGKQSLEKTSTPLLDLLSREKDNLEAQQKASLSELSSEDQAVEKSDAEKMSEKGVVTAFADKLLNGFVQDAVKQFQQIKKARNEKIVASNQRRGNEANEDDWLGGKTSTQYFPYHTTQKDNLPNFLEEGQEEVSSPELCNRPESPVLGASGQEELAKRLAELELSRELLDVLGDEQDWFDEDFGLSSRKEQQKQKIQLQKEGASATVGIGAAEQVKTPARPAPPQQAKPIEQPVMIVPHAAPEVEKLVHAATQEIWESCNLGLGLQTLDGVSTPLASSAYLGSDAQGEDLETLSKRSYKKAVFDLTWEIIQEIFSEDPNAHQPQWMKPRRINSSCLRRVQSPEDISKIQAYITTEVLKLYGLKKDQNQKTDWQKMLKFGRKKRDRVDHILVQELHEEESQWVNYDEDELFVKMQLADGIFDALVKDTVDILTKLQEKRTKRALS